MNKNSVVFIVVGLSSIGFAGCPGFAPQGSWDFSADRVEAFSTYTRSPAINVTVPAESLVPVGTSLVVATGVVIGYNAATNTVDFAGTPYVLDANHRFEIAHTEMVLPTIGGCVIVQYMTADFTFTGNEGHAADYRLETGYRLSDNGASPTCESTLSFTKSIYQSTGNVPSVLAQFVGMGGLRMSTIEQVRTIGLAQVVVGERVSASPSAPGSANVSEFVFVNAYTFEEMAALRDQLLGDISSLFAAE